MKPMPDKMLEVYRRKDLELKQFGETGEGTGEGMFIVPIGLFIVLLIISSQGEGWEHVSVSLETRAPSWGEMCLVKALFWTPEECVIQFHPPESDYVNHHPYCLHLWKPIGVEIPRPPTYMVGPKP